MSYFDQVNPDQTRWNGPAGHPDRFLTNSEMLLLGVGLWRAAQWYSENQRRLTPEEQARFDIDVARWRAYLEWEDRTPGAKEAREEYVYAQQAQAYAEQGEYDKKIRRILFWRPISLFWALIWGDMAISTEFLMPLGDSGIVHGAVTKAFGFLVWLFIWHFCLRVKRSWRRVRYQQAMEQATVQSRPVEQEPATNVPVLWDEPKP